MKVRNIGAGPYSKICSFGCLYDEDGIEREVVYIGPAPNFMENLKLELEVEGTLDPKEQEEATEE